MNNKIVATALVGGALALVLTGCGVRGVVDEKPTEVNQSAETATPEPKDDGILAFGETATFGDGFTISAAAPVEFVPGQYAAGATLPANVQIAVTATNGTEKPIDLLIIGNVLSGGVEGSHIFDTENNLGMAPTSTLLPGQSVTWVEGWSVNDPTDITLEISPGVFTYEDVFFTTSAQG